MTNSITLRRALLAAMLVATAAVGACNTAEGVGKDVESAGDAVQGHGQGRQEEDVTRHRVAGAGRPEVRRGATAGACGCREADYSAIRAMVWLVE